MNLHNLRVLVTRPRPQGEALCKKIYEAGGKPYYFPVIDIVPPQDEQHLHQQISEIDKMNWLIFISPQAVSAVARAIHTRWPIFPEQVKIAAVGQGTANALEAAGFKVAVFPQEDWRSEGLLALAAFQQLAHKKIAIICGAGGRELLADSLRDRGAQVERMVAYQRQLPRQTMHSVVDLSQKDAIDAVIVTSQEGLDNLQKLTTENEWSHLLSRVLVVVSDRIAVYAREKGFSHIVVAKNASHEQILDAMAMIDNERNDDGK